MLDRTRQRRCSAVGQKAQSAAPTLFPEIPLSESSCRRSGHPPARCVAAADCAGLADYSPGRAGAFHAAIALTIVAAILLLVIA